MWWLNRSCAPLLDHSIYFFSIGTVKNCKTSCCSVIELHSLRCKFKRVGYWVIKYLHGLRNYNLFFIRFNIKKASSHKCMESQRSKSGHSMFHLSWAVDTFRNLLGCLAGQHTSQSLWYPLYKFHPISSFHKTCCRLSKFDAHSVLKFTKNTTVIYISP